MRIRNPIWLASLTEREESVKMCRLFRKGKNGVLGRLGVSHLSVGAASSEAPVRLGSPDLLETKSFVGAED
jgi:hypothetical protein